MRGTMLTILPDGTEKLQPIMGAPTLDIMKQGLAGGMLEVVPLFRHVEWGSDINNCVAFCDEEGKLKGLPYNGPATIRWQESLARQGRSLFDSGANMMDHLVGPIIVLWGDKAFMDAL